MRNLLLLLATGSLALSACSDSSSSTGATAEPSTPAAMTAVVSHYPAQFLVSRVGGDLVDVENLTAPGAEPHDLELTPQQVAEVAEADAVFYIAGFQPAVDETVGEATGTVVNLTEGLPLRKGEEHSHEEEGNHAEEEAHGGAEITDPHVWLDPVLMQQMAGTVAETLSAADPEHSEQYAQNAAALEQELTSLDEQWSAGTKNCEIRTMVVSHEAFGYLADQYGFQQKGISGLSPENEPSAAAIAELAGFVKDNGVTTVYTETLVDPAVAETVAAEAGAQTATLDPLEGPPAQGDYISAMQENLETVRAGQSCS